MSKAHLAAPPDSLEVDGHGQIPDLLLGVESVVIGGVHDACRAVQEAREGRAEAKVSLERRVDTVTATHRRCCCTEIVESECRRSVHSNTLHPPCPTLARRFSLARYSQHDIEPSKLLHSLGHQVLDVHLLPNISDDGNGLGCASLELADKLDGALSSSGVDVGANDVSSLGSEGERRLESDSSTCSRDDGDLVGEAESSDLSDEGRGYVGARAG
jgi:hypothetical protein